MSRVPLFTDEDVYASVAVELRRRGFDALSTPEVSRWGQLMPVNSNGPHNRSVPW